MRVFRITLLSLLLIGILGVLQYRLWFEQGGITDMLRLKKQLALQQQLNDKLKKRNEKLLLQVQYLQANDDAVEARARSELGMIKKDEAYYQVVYP
jgi:cell division protein FtsB